MTQLAGRVAVVAGASRGIGLAAAVSLREAGATVVRLARSLDSGRGDGFIDVRCDLTRAADLAAAAQVAGAAGPVDVVVASAGAFSIAAFEQTTGADLESQLLGNVRVPFAVAQTFVPPMRQRGSGLLVLIGSVADHVALPGNTAYAASKYALRGFHETLVAELRGSGVRCSLLSPGPTDTPLWDPIDPDGRHDLPDRAAMLRPADVADAVVFLATRPAHVHIDWMRIGPA